MKLALTAGLRTLVAEHRPAIPKLLGTLADEAMLNGGSNHRGRSFGTQRAGPITTILKAVHLLADDIGSLPDPACEQFGDLKKRRADLLEAGASEVFKGDGLHCLPTMCLGGQQIHHAAQALQLTHAILETADQSAPQSTLSPDALP